MPLVQLRVHSWESLYKHFCEGYTPGISIMLSVAPLRCRLRYSTAADELCCKTNARLVIKIGIAEYVESYGLGERTSYRCWLSPSFTRRCAPLLECRRHPWIITSDHLTFRNRSDGLIGLVDRLCERVVVHLSLVLFVLLKEAEYRLFGITDS